jgi:bacterioferritin-associated ferredoxin
MQVCAERHGLELAWMSERAPEAILGRRKVTAIRSGGEVACDLFVVGVSQPAIELALQAGATAQLTTGELPIVAVTDAPDWLELAGSAAAHSSDVPDVAMDDRAFACLCEDVRVGDVRACVAQGFAHPELVKRRTGAMTGPCQGKLCSAAVLSVLRQVGVDAAPTRARPLARPVTLGELAADA